MHKQAVIDEMRVKPQIDVESEVETRVNFIKSQLLASGLKTLVSVSYTHLTLPTSDLV